MKAITKALLAVMIISSMLSIFSLSTPYAGKLDDCGNKADNFMCD